MKTFELKGVLRTEIGKKATKAVRVEKSVPCVLYGGSENFHFSTTVSDLQKLVYSPEVFLVKLEINGKKHDAIMKALQFHPVTDKVLHIDFLEVFPEKPVVVEIPVQVEGLAAGVKAGGKLSLEMRKLRVKGIYTQIPEKITLDVSALELGKTIQVGGVQVPNLEILNAKNAVVVQVKLTRAARGAAAAANAEK